MRMQGSRACTYPDNTYQDAIKMINDTAGKVNGFISQGWNGKR